MGQTTTFRYRRLGYVSLNVTALERSAQFYADVVGLTLTAAGPGFVSYQTGEGQTIRLCAAAEPGLKSFGFEMESEADLAVACAHLGNLNVPFSPIASDAAVDPEMSSGIRFRIPGCGVPVDLYATTRKANAVVNASTKIVRIGHCVIRVMHFDEAAAWLTTKLGFVVSDHIKGEQQELLFLRCWPSKYHHSFALARGDSNAFHHLSLMVNDIDDIGRALHRLPRCGAKIVFGPGRHVASDSIFLYFLEPDGMTLEFIVGMESFPEESARAPRVLPPRLDIADTWGSVPSPEVFSVGNIEGAGERARPADRSTPAVF